MSKHTPGPWFNGQDGFNLGSGVVYARHTNGNPKDVATIRGWGGEQQANSRLIAAAPDLLEALEAMVEYVDLMHAIGHIQRPVQSSDARAAIKKAKGR